jgi:hypoxanthine phosphoribosyltransferase
MAGYEYCSPEKIFDMTYKLGKRIQKEFRPDCLVGMGRGGLMIVGLLSDFLNNKNIFIIGARLYKDIEKPGEELEITQDVDERFIRNKKVLLVDDLVDTGITMLGVVRHIKAKGAAEIRTATLHYKPWSRIKPDYFIEETEKWIIYSKEIHETILSLSKNMPKEKVVEELEKAGVPKEMYQQFL